MSRLRRSVCCSVLSLSPPPSPPPSLPPSDDDPADPSQSFHGLSGDVLVSIFSLLSPRDLVSASLVCKSWLAAAVSETLWANFLLSECGPSWPLVLFAETSLPHGLSFSEPTKAEIASFRTLYNARHQQPRSVIIDGGSGYCKFGWNDSDRPTGIFQTYMAHGNIEIPMYASLRDFFSNVYGRLEARPSSQPVVISTPICYCDETDAAIAARRNLCYVTYKVLFDMGVRAVCAVDQAVLGLLAAKQLSGIVVNIGFQLTSVVPVLHGKIMRNIGVEVTGQGALQLTAHLSELMQLSGIYFDNIAVVKVLKENLCYVAYDYEAELCKNTEASYVIDSQVEFKLNHERFMACEILFQPQIGGLQAMSLQQAVALCMEHCAQIYDDFEWYKTVVLCGGSACLPGLSERLRKELCKILPSSLSQSVTVIPPQHESSVWLGAKVISNLSSFQDCWCITKKDFKVIGQELKTKGPSRNLTI